MTTAEPDVSYDIFENSEDYFNKEALIDSILHPYDANFCYTSGNSDFQPDYSLMNLCKNFVIFLEKLQTDYPNDTTEYSKYREYLNFWLSYKLTATGKSNDYITKFYEFIQNNYKAFPPDGELKRKIYHIKGNNFNNMSILYDLYRLYYEIKHISQEKCEKFHEKFMKNYNLAISKCYTDEEKLCNPLEKFKQFYDITRASRLHMCSTQGLPELPKFVTPKPSDGMNFINKFSYRLSQLSKKQTEETHSIISNREYPNLAKFLSFNYNLLLYSNEKEKRNNMMEILYEFIKFCKDRNTISFLDSLIHRFFKGFYEQAKSKIPFLNSFIEEFFEYYYKHSEYEYELIYKECSINKSSSSSYCTLYNKCSQQLGEDLYKIKDDIQAHLKYKPTPAQVLTKPLAQSFDSKNLQKEVSLHIGEDDNGSSHTTPINVGVGVGALFTLSFLYKFTPLGSWVNRTFLGKGNTMYNYEEENDQDFFDHNSGFDNYISENNRLNVAYGAS
ncbi:PIR Superfamily Protein [Plasmodium ovale wallikeri]|uniref:PIR Superfamily Protein n=1 Tax=Plasmodium ovale wallikeri TaxID=864142 RepID=A0A1A9AHZ6_PLAOA|nr:PIR Superfamily Protein [Plasmodium ovale wallikeri]SBT58057.1 PIR Superfamily Protein [Plasmodium ovale wallikeri]